MEKRWTATEVLAEWDAVERTEWDSYRARCHALYPNPERILVAIRLANDLEACRALLRGEPVDPARLDARELKAALEPRFVQMVRPIDVLHGRAA